MSAEWLDGLKTFLDVFLVVVQFIDHFDDLFESYCFFEALIQILWLWHKIHGDEHLLKFTALNWVFTWILLTELVVALTKLMIHQFFILHQTLFIALFQLLNQLLSLLIRFLKQEREVLSRLLGLLTWFLLQLINLQIVRLNFIYLQLQIALKLCTQLQPLLYHILYQFVIHLRVNLIDFQWELIKFLLYSLWSVQGLHFHWLELLLIRMLLQLLHILKLELELL